MINLNKYFRNKLRTKPKRIAVEMNKTLKVF